MIDFTKDKDVFKVNVKKLNYSCIMQKSKNKDMSL